MKALQAICTVGAVTFTGMILQVAPTPGVTVADAMQEAVVGAEPPAWPALSAAVPESSAGPETVPVAVSGPSVMVAAEIGDDPNVTKSVDLKLADPRLADLGHQEAAKSVPATRDASDDAPKPTPARDFRYL